MSILDISIAAKAFESYLRHPRWDETADVDKNDLINIMNLVSEAVDYGKTSARLFNGTRIPTIIPVIGKVATPDTNNKTDVGRWEGLLV